MSTASPDSQGTPRQHRFMNEIHSELERMVARRVTHVVAELILLLIAQRWKQRDRSGELVVAVRLEARDRQRRGTERKREREAERGIARLRQMQQAGVEDERSQPGRAELVSVADDAIPVVVVRGQSGRGQRGLLPPARCASDNCLPTHAETTAILPTAPSRIAPTRCSRETESARSAEP